ncbi:hypothetical protein ncot_00170 [Nocardioides sp. JQ2195]|uniref:hypothetical protein n=1 Tax=Nocardioides sp. JQ2195 TaxID=2592334 RepID=UPI00143EB15F|nr:hypothetical protein [Nocardioides sp. JQ2195]QIX25174.1 hypothetical protein ncot_00170 [Nocardioides sp. JQ2195]
MTESHTPEVSIRSEILQRHAESVAEWRASDGASALDGDEFDSAANRARLEALRALDPQASLGEELRVRLVSPVMQEGALSFDAGALLLRPLQDSVASLAGDGVDLELVGVSAGSTVLHVRPRDGSAESGPVDVGGVPIDATSTEDALRAFVELLRAAESESDLGEWVRAVDALGRFSRALERLEAEADVAWWGVSGEVRSAWFGRTGRAYVERMLETTPRPEILTIFGRVTELRESGVVKVKTGARRKSPSYEVKMESEDLLAMHLEIGESVHFTVRVEQGIDHLGQAQSTDVYFVSNATGFSATDSSLPIDEDDDSRPGP